MGEQERDRRIRDEEEAAAAEAGRIGGTAGDEDVPPAQRPVVEAGGGEAEGFELAEEDLIEHAEHQEGEGIPRLDQFGTEAEDDPAVYGEADEEDSTAVVEDPETGEDDPGAGPGITSER
jgi:hypothetical protein